MNREFFFLKKSEQLALMVNRTQFYQRTENKTFTFHAFLRDVKLHENDLQTQNICVIVTNI